MVTHVKSSITRRPSPLEFMFRLTTTPTYYPKAIAIGIYVLLYISLQTHITRRPSPLEFMCLSIIHFKLTLPEGHRHWNLCVFPCSHSRITRRPSPLEFMWLSQLLHTCMFCKYISKCGYCYSCVNMMYLDIYELYMK
jgi:hypothetical protein